MKIDKNMAVSIEKKALEEICRHYFIKRLAIFGGNWGQQAILTFWWNMTLPTGPTWSNCRK